MTHREGGCMSPACLAVVVMGAVGGGVRGEEKEGAVGGGVRGEEKEGAAVEMPA